MYKSIRTIQKEANVALSGRRGIYILMLTVSMAIVSVFGASGLLSLAGTLFAILFQVGMFAFLLKLCCGQKEQAQFNDLFYVFKSQNGEVGKAILLYLLQALYILPAAIIYAVLIAVFAFAEAKAISQWDLLATASLSVGFIIFIAVALIAFFIYCLYISITYAMVTFVLLDYPALTTKEIWQRTSQLLKGSRLRYIGLELSYFVWFLIPIAISVIGAMTNPILIVLGVAGTVLCTLWIVPSMHCARAIFYLDLVQRHTKSATPVVEDMIVTPVE